MQVVSGGKAMNKSSLFEWHKWFKDWRKYVRNIPRSENQQDDEGLCYN